MLARNPLEAFVIGLVRAVEGDLKGARWGRVDGRTFGQGEVIVACDAGQ